MIRTPAPAADKRDGIGQAVADALGIDVRAVALSGDTLEIDAPDSAKTKAQDTVKAHTPPPRPAHPTDLAERLAAVESELRGMRDRAAAVTATGGAAAVRDAITGPAR